VCVRIIIKGCFLEKKKKKVYFYPLLFIVRLII